MQINSQTNFFEAAVRQTAAGAIAGYQKYISPYKGFSCAYRVLHRGESCSQYAKRMILAEGISNALPAIRRRFQACKTANERLRLVRASFYSLENSSERDRQRKERSQNSGVWSCDPATADCCTGSVDCCDLGAGAQDCSLSDRAGCGDCNLDADCGNWDGCSNCSDCGACGDCGAADFGSCGN